MSLIFDALKFGPDPNGLAPFWSISNGHESSAFIEIYELNVIRLYEINLIFFFYFFLYNGLWLGKSIQVWALGVLE